MTLLDERERVAITLTLSMDYFPVEKNIELGQLRVDVLDAIPLQEYLLQILSQ
jgi:hypothetical protein